MNKSLPTALALGFFAGIFLLAFSSSDTLVAMYRVIGFVGLACFGGLVAIYWHKIRSVFSTGGPRVNAMERRPASFTRNYSNMAVLSDKLRVMRQKRHRPTLFHH